MEGGRERVFTAIEPFHLFVESLFIWEAGRDVFHPGFTRECFYPG